MRKLELHKGGNGGLFLACGSTTVAEFLGRREQAQELVDKFNEHAELVKALRELMDYAGGWDSGPRHPCGRAAALLDRIQSRVPQ